MKWEEVHSQFQISRMFSIEVYLYYQSTNSYILLVGAITEKPIVKDGKIEVGHIVKLSLACDRQDSGWCNWRRNFYKH